MAAGLTGNGSMLMQVGSGIFGSASSQASLMTCGAVDNAQGLKNGVIDALEVLLAQDAGDDDLMQAIGYLHMSLGEDDPRAGMSGSEVVWLDPNPVYPRKGEDAFQYEQESCDKQEAYLANEPHREFGSGDEIDAVLQTLVEADRMLAVTAINDAIATGGNPQDIEDAVQLLNEGIAASEQGRSAICDVALDKFEEARKRQSKAGLIQPWSRTFIAWLLAGVRPVVAGCGR